MRLELGGRRIFISWKLSRGWPHTSRFYSNTHTHTQPLFMQTSGYKHIYQCVHKYKAGLDDMIRCNEDHQFMYSVSPHFITLSLTAFGKCGKIVYLGSAPPSTQNGDPEIVKLNKSLRRSTPHALHYFDSNNNQTHAVMESYGTSTFYRPCALL